ncbi:KOW domain-containing RNA-binding protein [Eubacterium aggregans]|uniref:KOW domain-containing RNA-binding protein n=1 Tax=Eubacterium aggregans TaxID=81409 RepID=UPI003F390900
MKDLTLGQVVRSTAGRDKDLFMLVVKIIDEDFVLLADGDLRKLSHPKRKKLTHLAKTNHIVSIIQEKLMSGEKVQNAEIRKVLEPFNSNNNKSVVDVEHEEV